MTGRDIKDIVDEIIGLLSGETGEGPGELLREAGFDNVETAEHNTRVIAELTEVSPTLLREIIGAAAESFHPDTGLNNMERFLNASKDRGRLCASLEEKTDYIPILMALFSGSQLLTDSFLQMGLGPERLASWLSSGAGETAPERAGTKEEMWSELSAALETTHTLKEKASLVRTFKKKEYIRIGLRDLLKAADTVDTLRSLSDLADVCLEAAYAACHRELVKKYGEPRYAGPRGEEESRFCIIGLGKLGGEELNFSSDIDIIYLYSSDEGITRGIPGSGGRIINRISNYKYYSRLGAMITNFMSEITPEGSIFRVDLRLRPEGSMGNIAYSLRSYEIYYESYGVTLERQALIKARVCAGDEELGEKFLSMIKPFIYRKHLDYAAIEEIKQMKETIDRRLKRDKVEEGHVKLGYGGIREIEFVIQAFQLVYGGRDERLQINNSLQALEGLRAGGYLDEKDRAALREAYLFLRDLENRLQISHGLQTHSLPDGDESLAIVARKMGLSGGTARELAGALMNEYGKQVEAVRAVYNNLFYAKAGEGETHEAPLDLDDRESAQSGLAAAGFSAPEKALQNLALLRDGPVYSHPTERSKLIFNQLLPNLLRMLSGSPDPDMALNHLERFVNGSRSRETLLSLFLEEERLLDLLTRLFGNSEILSRILIQQPNLMDTMLQREEMVSFKSRDDFLKDLLFELQPMEGWNEKLNEIRRFKQAEDLRIGIKQILGHQDTLETVAELSNLAEAVLRVAQVMVEAELMARYGAPMTGEGEKSKVSIIGMGKLGGREMSFGSDLDILIVFSGEGRTAAEPDSPNDVESIPNNLYYTRFYRELLSAVSAATPSGRAYKVDMRLRPEGDKGAFALPLARFEEYFNTEEQAWVRQAMIKARPVAGDPELGARFMAAAHDFTYSKGLNPAQARDIAHNRERIEKELAREVEGHRDLKHGLGGLTDIEFAVQLLQLKYGSDYPKIRMPGTLNALRELSLNKIIDGSDYRDLQEAYLFLRDMEMSLRIVEERPVHAIPDSPGEQDKLARRLGYTGQGGQREGRELMSRYNQLTSRVRDIYRGIVRQMAGNGGDAPHEERP